MMARPFVSTETIGRCFAKAEEVGGAVPVLPVTDTLRRRTEGEGSETVDRSRYFRVQTPQVFDVRLLKEAYAQPYRPEYTDDASVYEYSGAHRVAPRRRQCREHQAHHAFRPAGGRDFGP